MRDKPSLCYELNCPLATTCECSHHISLHIDDSNCTFVEDKTGVKCQCAEFRSKGRGFVLGAGDPISAKYAFVFEAPGKDEVNFDLDIVKDRSFYSNKIEVDTEINRRRLAYPNIDSRYIKRGVPVVGKTWAALEQWVFNKVGIKRSELFIDNTLRCLPPKKKNRAYPTGEDRKMAEKCCRVYDRIDQFKPDTLVFTLHPAGILREITPLPLLIKDLERTRDFTELGRRVITLFGGMAVKAFARFGENVTKWRGNYVILKDKWINEYKSLFEFKAKQKKVKIIEAKRPENLDQNPCKSYKRYKGKRPPKCNKGAGCAPCWDKFEQVQKETNVKIIAPLNVPTASNIQSKSFRKWDSIFELSPEINKPKFRRRKQEDV